MNKRKLLTLAMTLCMVAILAIGGTLAYFTDTEQYTNVMEIGDVDINIEELMKNPEWTATNNEDKYIDFDPEAFTLYPATNEKGINMYNKLVSVFNESAEHDAYIRTIVLIEANEACESCDDPCCVNGVHFAYTEGDYQTTANGKTYQGQGTKNVKLADTVTINNDEYHVIVFTDKNNEAIKKGESQDSLTGVWLDANMTDEEAKAYQGNLDVIVFAQGIQSTNLTHDEAMAALGEVNEANLQAWLTGAPKAEVNDIY